MHFVVFKLSTLQNKIEREVVQCGNKELLVMSVFWVNIQGVDIFFGFILRLIYWDLKML